MFENGWLPRANQKTSILKGKNYGIKQFAFPCGEVGIASTSCVVPFPEHLRQVFRKYVRVLLLRCEATVQSKLQQ